MSRTIESNPYFSVVVDDEQRIVYMRRSAQPYPSLEVVTDTMERLASAVAQEQFRDYGVLLDSRDAPGRNDPQFEQVIVGYAPRLFSRFARRAVLLRSVAGVLHANRVFQQSPPPAACHLP